MFRSLDASPSGGRSKTRSVSMNRSPAPRRALAIALLAAFVAPLAAQQTQLYPVGKIWVDPANGVDTNPGSSAAPVMTITRALALCNPIPAGFTDMVIMLRPGIYGSTLESFPLQMTKNTSLQGAGALNTVIKGDLISGQVLIKFEADVVNEFNRTFIDGLSIREGDINIRIENNATHRFASKPLISNCFICDARTWAIDIVSAPNGAAGETLVCTPPVLLPQTGWVVHRPKVVNCTFRNNRHVIMNRTNTFPLDVDGPPILGVSEPGLMNLLCADSHLQGPPRIAKDDLIGIDSKDLEIVVAPGSPPTLLATSCAFDLANTGGLFDPLLNPNCLPGVSTQGLPPVPLFSPANVAANFAPMFIEDVVGNPFPGANAVDVRLNPALAGISGGIGPVDTGYLPAGDQVTWSNGTVCNLQLVRNNLAYADVRDVDCEGYGNPRVVGLIDVGADELGELVVAGYQLYTTDFRPGDTVFRWIGPGYAGDATKYSLTKVINGSTVPFPDANSFPFLLRPANTTAPYSIPGLSGSAWFVDGIPVGQVLNGTEPTTATNLWTGLGLLQINEQWLLPGSALVTNLQSFTL